MRPSGIVFGFLLAIGLAYWHDHWGPVVGSDGTAHALVNWDEFGRLAHEFGAWLKDQADRLLAALGWRG